MRDDRSTCAFAVRDASGKWCPMVGGPTHGIRAAAGDLRRRCGDLAKAEAIWEQAQTMLPRSSVLGSVPGFDDPARAWIDLIGGCLLSTDGPSQTRYRSPTTHGRSFLDWME